MRERQIEKEIKQRLSNKYLETVTGMLELKRGNVRQREER
jgi:hypothetical protein